MTYFGFLLCFLVIPIILLWGLRLWKPQRDKSAQGAKAGNPVWIAIGVQIALALLYTTPWETIWWLQPSGITAQRLSPVCCWDTFPWKSIHFSCLRRCWWGSGGSLCRGE